MAHPDLHPNGPSMADAGELVGITMDLNPSQSDLADRFPGSFWLSSGMEVFVEVAEQPRKQWESHSLLRVEEIWGPCPRYLVQHPAPLGLARANGGEQSPAMSEEGPPWAQPTHCPFPGHSLKRSSSRRWLLKSSQLIPLSILTLLTISSSLPKTSFVHFNLRDYNLARSGG